MGCGGWKHVVEVWKCHGRGQMVVVVIVVGCIKVLVVAINIVVMYIASDSHWSSHIPIRIFT